jgi:hypothetical protein
MWARWLSTVGAALVLPARWLGLRRCYPVRRPRLNPYVVGAPVFDNGMFVGRADLIARVVDSLRLNSVLLSGERRIGKTSLLYHLKRRLREVDDPSRAFFPVSVDLAGVREDRLFATIAEDLAQELRALKGAIGPSDLTEPVCDDSDLGRGLRSIALNLATLCPEKTPRIVLLIDEADELNAFEPATNHRLRRLLTAACTPHVAAVLAGAAIARDWDRAGSPWYSFLEEITIGPLTRDEGRRLIVEPLAGTLDLDEGVVERILALTGSKPFLIQKVCSALVDRMTELGQRRATVADVDTVSSSDAVRRTSVGLWPPGLEP